MTGPSTKKTNITTVLTHPTLHNRPLPLGRSIQVSMQKLAGVIVVIKSSENVPTKLQMVCHFMDTLSIVSL